MFTSLLANILAKKCCCKASLAPAPATGRHLNHISSGYITPVSLIHKCRIISWGGIADRILTINSILIPIPITIQTLALFRWFLAKNNWWSNWLHSSLNQVYFTFTPIIIIVHVKLIGNLNNNDNILFHINFPLRLD